MIPRSLRVRAHPWRPWQTFEGKIVCLVCGKGSLNWRHWRLMRDA